MGIRMVNKSALSLIIVLALSFLLPAQLLQWEPSLMQSGQWWRLFTGHLVHLNTKHLFLNLAGLLALVVLFPRFLPIRTALLAVPLMAITISFGLFLLRPELPSYRGFSGCLHGLAAMLALKELKTETFFSIALLATITVKLALEAIGLERSQTAVFIEGTVVWESHLLGFISGLVIAGATQIRNRKQSQSSPE